ncbi:hypothetical protein [Wenjunlia tyrosinilytica]|jgi:hypothetical protein|uniref:Uncharacterized protein n=1 Tax=Wenjunlia tyrosinilytica TaxID=1544741 RepID=A0A917ZTP3_9ACTN|nr:hypothetical protein [Wenjunlia tyrosinilytica]GGO91018.1 hypothetical protein GCM10012280_37920 [Wenjunlia tyrosinilytica]
MEPVSTALVAAAITAAATSAGSEAGRGVWGSFTALSHRVLGRGEAGEPRVSPDDSAERLAALADLLVERARRDEEFAADLARWLADAGRPAESAGQAGDVRNTVSEGAHIGGNVVQARDITGGISFGAPSAP